jgi:hypothetical protein
MKRLVNRKPATTDGLYLAVVSESQGVYYFLTDGERRLTLDEAVNELTSEPTLAHLDVTQFVAETDRELRFS